MKNKYKEQMSKISVDDEMKKRVLSKLRKSQEDKKEKKFIFKGQAIYKYTTVAAAFCALAVTYAITTHFPELMNNEEQISNQNGYDMSSVEDSSKEDMISDGYNENIKETTKNESNIIKDNEKGSNNKPEDDNLNISRNQQENISGRERQSYNDNPSNIELNVSLAEADQKNVSIDTDEVKESDNSTITTAGNSQVEIENNNIIKETTEEDKLKKIENNDNEDIRIASYHDENSKERDYLFQHGVPDLSDLNFNINYVNQISQNEIEVMYLSDKETDLWIRIRNSEDDDKTYKRDSKYVIYKKNDKNYYIWSTSNIDSSIMDNVITRI
ncbi:hypothetical protein [uncultured Clostridium sp.]|uniref:hypothetical protein n=1 Tax=uncultured Clostridium sp. TaxID=59620 RepID=UPI0025F5F577|nr:hypothetical protein [uncultured Clostridium sp.]